jgi:hypothetical protein
VCIVCTSLVIIFTVHQTGIRLIHANNDIYLYTKDASTEIVYVEFTAQVVVVRETIRLSLIKTDRVMF